MGVPGALVKVVKKQYAAAIAPVNVVRLFLQWGADPMRDAGNERTPKARKERQRLLHTLPGL